ncbi:hypothetical protein KSS87_009634 [Heliosperma pusillum]|nr:hypothetical protein KSS87_009634 [Heliosperma pusillum]
MAASRRAIQLGSLTRCLFSGKSRGDCRYNFTAVAPEINRRLNFDYRQIAQIQVPSNGKRAFLVDTLAMVRSLEKEGIPSKQAEAITSAITGVLNDTLENVSYSFVSKGEMQKIELVQDGNISKFKTEVQTSQDHHFALLQRETEKLQGDIEKLQRELKYEIDKVTAGQRLDLNLEKGLGKLY